MSAGIKPVRVVCDTNALVSPRPKFKIPTPTLRSLFPIVRQRARIIRKVKSVDFRSGCGSTYAHHPERSRGSEQSRIHNLGVFKARLPRRPSGLLAMTAFQLCRRGTGASAPVLAMTVIL